MLFRKLNRINPIIANGQKTDSLCPFFILIFKLSLFLITNYCYAFLNQQGFASLIPTTGIITIPMSISIPLFITMPMPTIVSTHFNIPPILLIITLIFPKNRIYGYKNQIYEKIYKWCKNFIHLYTIKKNFIAQYKIRKKMKCYIFEILVRYLKNIFSGNKS